MALSISTVKALSVPVWIFTQHTTQRDSNHESMSAPFPEHFAKSDTIRLANATHSIRGSKTLSRHRPETAPQERGGLLSNARFFLFVSFQLWNEQLQWGIRTNFKQGQIKMHSLKLPSILSQGKVYSTLITLLFPPTLLISPIRPCGFFFPHLSLLCSLCLFSPLSLLLCDLLQGPQGGI